MYRLRTQLPHKAKLLIYHSFIQSHLNYCSLVMGFSAKSHIDSLFSKQKSGVRSVMSGKVIYKYRSEDEQIPTHTKSSFNNFRILTIQNLIAKNALLLIHRVQFYPASLPSSIVNLFPIDAPCFTRNKDHDTNYSNIEWLNTSNNPHFRTSCFFECPLLAISEQNSSLIENEKITSSLRSYKVALHKFLLESQKLGTDDEWPLFLIHNIQGLRKSKRNI